MYLTLFNKNSKKKKNVFQIIIIIFFTNASFYFSIFLARILENA